MPVFYLRNDDINILDEELINVSRRCTDENVPITHAVEPANVTDDAVAWLLKEKQKDAKGKKGSVSAVGQSEDKDSTSDDDETYSQYGQRRFSIQALRPNQQVDSGTPWNCAQVQPSSSCTDPCHQQG